MFPDLLRQTALEDSVQKHRPYTEGAQFFTSSATRSDVLQPHGSRLREWQLRQLWYSDYNTTFKGGIKGLIKRVQSTPYSIKTDKDDADYWQDLLMTADFSDWDTFLSKLILDYSRQDQGAFIRLGMKYVWGGGHGAKPGPTGGGLDCSGLTREAWAKVGVDIGGTTYDQIKTGRAVNPNNWNQLKPGVLLFPHAVHVLMYIGNGKAIHAPQAGDVVREVPVTSRDYMTVRRPVG